MTDDQEVSGEPNLHFYACFNINILFSLHVFPFCLLSSQQCDRPLLYRDMVFSCLSFVEISRNIMQLSTTKAKWKQIIDYFSSLKLSPSVQSLKSRWVKVWWDIKVDAWRSKTAFQKADRQTDRQTERHCYIPRASVQPHTDFFKWIQW